MDFFSGIRFGEPPRSRVLVIHYRAVQSLPLEALADLLAQSRFQPRQIFLHFVHSLAAWLHLLEDWHHYVITVHIFIFYSLITMYQHLNFLCLDAGVDANTLRMVIGAMYTAVMFVGINNCATVQPIVSIERTVFYRERAAGMYSALPYAIAQVRIE